MKPITLLAQAALCGALALCAGTAAAQTYTKAQLQETYSQHLAAEGFRPELTAQGNVRFKRESRTYAVMVDEADPTFYRVVLSFSADDKSAAARLRRLEGTNLASAEAKVIKAYIDSDGDPVFSAEMFLVVPGDFKTTLVRVLRAMDSAYEKYTKKIAETR